MAEPPVISGQKPSRSILLAWAVTATLMAFLSTALAVLFWLQAQRRPVIPTPSASASPFLDLAESAVAGRYKWMSKSGGENFMTLNEDHSFINKDGTRHPAHRWEITRDALVIFWLRSQTRFNRIERPGVYVELKDGMETARIEKQE